MIEAEIAIVPIGTCSTSISEFVAESERVLDKYPELTYKITSMATEIEGKDIDRIFDALKEMHLAQINKGASRLQTTIRIDDRRDKDNTMSEKISSLKCRI